MPVEPIPLNTKEAEVVLEPGKFYSKINCYGSYECFYALYIPVSFNKSKKMPVVLFFDPQGKGLFPLEKYKTLADRYGYVLSGSHFSKNGISFQLIHDNVTYWRKDLLQRFSADEKRIYLAGFSGGARMAGGLALIDNSYAGVISCSAGFSVEQLTSHHSFTFFGMAGTEDLNYLEVKELEQSLVSTSLSHLFLISEGGHEWPVLSKMAFAFDFLEMEAMKNKNTIVNNTLINNFVKRCTEEAQVLKAQKKWTELERHYRMEIKILTGLQSKRSIENLWNSCKNSIGYSLNLKTENENEEKERKEREKFIEAFNSKDQVWWENEIVKIISVCNRLNFSPEISLYKRLKGFLGLVTFMKANQALNTNDLNLATKFLFIYRSIEPENNESYFLTAILMARKGDTKNLFENLKKAIELGFNDRERVERTTEFESLRNTEEYKKVIVKISQKSE